MNSFSKIACFAVNMARRTDRKRHLEKEFSGRPEFELTIVPAIEQPPGAAGLWRTIQSIVRVAAARDTEYIVLCEDDHQFTDEYSEDLLRQSIANAQRKGADLLLGGVSWFKNGIQVSENLFWVEKFTGLQFSVIFKKFYPTLLNTLLEKTEAVDLDISKLSDRKFLIYPFLSIQREFGYSDVTLKNNVSGIVTQLFTDALNRCKLLHSVRQFYGSSFEVMERSAVDFGQIVLPVSVMNNNASGSVRQWNSQFAHRKEFDVSVIHYPEVAFNNAGVWEGLRLCLQEAIRNGEDFIILCTETLEFTEHYSKELLISALLEANGLSCDVLLGSLDRIGHVLPVRKHLFWTDGFTSAPFIVIYRKCFEKILLEHYDGSIGIFRILSGLTSHKLVLYPFIAREAESHAAGEAGGNNAAASSHYCSEKLGAIQNLFLKLKDESFMDNKAPFT